MHGTRHGAAVAAMREERARELLMLQVSLGGGYNRNAAKLILAEVERVHGIETVNRLIDELELEAHFGFVPGSRFHRPG